jgi:molybdenum-dependent DNA-binding transcriptional regulator ModE
MVDGQVVIGPVQAMLLEAIRATGSIAAAQRQIVPVMPIYGSLWQR